jgi:hypothetical protein
MTVGNIQVPIVIGLQNSVQVDRWEVVTVNAEDKVIIVIHGADGSTHPFQLERQQAIDFGQNILMVDKSTEAAMDTEIGNG